MAYKCNTCNKYALDEDDRPCGDMNCAGKFSIVTTIHFAEQVDGQLHIKCLGGPSKNPLRFTSWGGASTCPRCRDLLDAESKARNDKEEQEQTNYVNQKIKQLEEECINGVCEEEELPEK